MDGDWSILGEEHSVLRVEFSPFSFVVDLEEGDFVVLDGDDE